MSDLGRVFIELLCATVTRWDTCRLVLAEVVALAQHAPEAMGCAVAWCGALLVTGELAVRGVGTPCPTCLAELHSRQPLT